MKQVVRRLMFILLLALYLAGSAWWVLTVPGSPANVLRAIPGQATLVSMHDHLADRWRGIDKHLVTLGLVDGFGGDRDEWRELQNDPGFNYILNLVGADKLAVGYVPLTGFQAEPIVVMSSWIGGRSQRLRLSLPFMDIKGLTYVREIGDWPVWRYRWNSEGGGGQITLALVEGMILGCLSDDDAAMEYVIDVYNGTYPSVLSRKDLARWNLDLIQSRSGDRLWYTDNRIAGTSPLAGPWLIEFGFTNDTRIAGTARELVPVDFGASAIAAFDPAGLDALWGRRPIAISVLDHAVIAPAIATSTGMVADIVHDVLGDKPGGIAVGMFGGSISGRFKGIKVPTFMAAMTLPPDTDVDALIRRKVDSWNARYRWGLVPVASAVGTSLIYRLEGTADNFYSTLSASEQVAITRAGNWLVVSSNFKGLEALASNPENAGNGSRAPWAEQVDWMSSNDGLGYLGVDLIRGSETIRLAISAYSLKLLFEDASGSRETRQSLNEIKAWLDVAARLEQLQVTARRDGEYLAVDFSAGP